MLKPKKKGLENRIQLKKSEEKLLYVVEVTCGNASIVRRVKCCTIDREAIKKKIHYTDLGTEFMRNLDYIDIIIFKEFESQIYTYTKEGEEVYWTSDIDTYEVVRYQLLKREIDIVLNPTYLTDGGMVEELNYFLKSWTKWSTKDVNIYNYTREDFESLERLTPTSCYSKEVFTSKMNHLSKMVLRLLVKSHMKELIGVLEYKEGDSDPDKFILGLILIKIGTKGRTIEEFSCLPLKVNIDSFKEFQTISK